MIEKLKNKILLLMTFLFIFSNCEKENSKVNRATLEIQPITQTSESLTFKIVASNASSLAFICQKGVAVSNILPSKIFSDGIALKDNFNKEHVINSLESGTLYTIFAVAKNDLGYSLVKRIEMTTSQLENNTQIQIRILGKTITEIEAEFVPSNKDEFYLPYRLSKQEVIDNKLDSDDKIHEYIKNDILSKSPGYTIQEVIKEYIVKDTFSGRFKSLKSNTEYYIYAYVVDIEANRLTKIFKTTETTEYRELSDITFNLSVEKLTPFEVNLSVEPSNLDENFVWLSLPKSSYPKAKTGLEIAEQYVEKWSWLLDGGQGVVKGEQTLNSVSVIPQTEYFIIAFSYKDGINSNVEMKTYITDDSVNPQIVTFSSEVKLIKSNKVEIEIKQSELAYYWAEVIATSDQIESDIEEIIRAYKKRLEDDLIIQQSFNPYYTMAEVVSRLSLLGTKIIQNEDLRPETNYSLVVFCVNKDGSIVANIHKEINKFTTSEYEVSEATLISSVKLFDGEKVADSGLLPDSGDKIRENVILAIHLTVSDDSSEAFMAIGGEPSSETDLELIDNLEWTRLDPRSINSNPYSIYSISWDNTYTIYTYAKDADGLPGVISRNTFISSREYLSPIDDLRDILEQNK